MTITEPLWTEVRAVNRRILDAGLLLWASVPVPYGSPQWHALPMSHPDKAKAVRRAAEAWRKWWEPDARRTRQAADADALDRAVTARLRAASHAVAGSTAWGGSGPSWAELERRRYPWLHDPDWQSPDEIAHGREWLGTDNGDDFARYLANQPHVRKAAA
jgi:hypothetical protein